MRKIKFRVWDKRGKRFTTTGIYLSNTTLTVDNITDVEIMQFMGLQDKNGNDIYEGDIIKNERGDLGVIVVKDHCFETTVSETQSSLYRSDYYTASEISGNIYENPEMLTSKNL